MIKIKIGDQIFGDIGENVFEGIVTEVREMAVRVDYAVESVWHKGAFVYNRSTWLPKSQIEPYHGAYRVKSWVIAPNRLQGQKIKPYFFNSNREVVPV